MQQIKFKIRTLLSEDKDFIKNTFDISENLSIEKKLKVYYICRKLIEIELFFSTNIDSLQSEKLFFVIL